jgi:malate dehydrogenase (oxaloacetate-decarboxylating)(NADP+)
VFWLIYSHGLVTKDRGESLADHKIHFAREDNDGQQFELLEEVVDFVKPTCLIGLCTIGGVFTEPTVRKMAELNNKPIISPLSNPPCKSECTFEQAMEWTGNRAILASDSHKTSYTRLAFSLRAANIFSLVRFPWYRIGDYLFSAKPRTSRESMIYASAAGLPDSLNEAEIARGGLHTELKRAREVSVVVAREVVRAAQRDGVDSHKLLSEKKLDEHINSRLYVRPQGRCASKPRCHEGRKSFP